jgi:hypothetical protein
MSEKLLAIRRNALTESGLYPSTNSLDAPLWRDGRNVITAQGGPQKVPGHVAPTGLTAVPATSSIRGMGALQDLAAIQRLFFGTASALSMWVAGTFTDVTRTTGAYTGYADQTSTHPASTWSITRFGNFAYAANGKDLGQKWLGTGGTGKFADWTTTWLTAEVLLTRGPHLLAFNTDAHPGGFEWCSADAPNDWSPSSTNSAGFLDVREVNGPLVGACLALGEIIAAGKNQLYFVSYSGAPFYFGYKSLGLDGVGCVGKTAIVGTNRMVYGMSDAGIWESDGNTWRYIDDEPIRAFITERINTAQKSKVCFSYDPTTQTVYISFPGATGENEWTMTYRVPTQAWGILPYGRSAMLAESGVFLKPYMAGVASAGTAKVYQHNTGVDADGSAVTAWIRTKDLDCGDDNAIKSVDFIKVQTVRLTGDAYVRVGWRNSLSDSADDDGIVTWSAALPLTNAFTPIYLPMDVAADLIAGAFLTVEIGSTELGSDFAVTGFELWGTNAGTLVS